MKFPQHLAWHLMQSDRLQSSKIPLATLWRSLNEISKVTTDLYHLMVAGNISKLEDAHESRNFCNHGQAPSMPKNEPVA